MKNKKHESYKDLIWMLAITDFKLRYQNSVLGYIWALLQPLMMFAILNFVFSSIFAPNGEIEYYALKLITSLMLFTFFADGTTAGLRSLVAKSQLVTKIYVPRWTIILASSLNALMIFLTNLVIIIGFFAWYKVLPTISAITMSFVFIVVLYLLILGFSFFTATLFVKFRDLEKIWNVVIPAMMYSAPIIYPLELLPEEYHKYILLNPLAFIAHFNKEALINNHFATVSQYITFFTIVIVFFGLSIWSYNKQSRKIAEYI